MFPISWIIDIDSASVSSTHTALIYNNWHCLKMSEFDDLERDLRNQSSFGIKHGGYWRPEVREIQSYAVLSYLHVMYEDWCTSASNLSLFKPLSYTCFYSSVCFVH